MGQLRATCVAFIADGAHSNWENQKTNFPGAIEILDFYHAAEHVGEFCSLFECQSTGTQKLHRWRTMLRQGRCCR